LNPSKALLTLSILTALLAFVQSGLGLFWRDGGSPFTFTTLHGQTIQMSGQGIYRYDPFFNAPILRATDAVVLFVCIPLLVLSIVLYWRGSLRGQILLTSLLSFFLYYAASTAFGVAYNNLFLIYIASFSTSLFAFVLAFRSIDLHMLSSTISPSLPRKGIAGLLFIAALAVMAAWLSDIIIGLLQGQLSAIASYTTEVTYVIDLGVIAPAAILAAILLLRRSPAGYILSPILLVNLAIIGLVVTAQSVSQSLAGITLSTGEFVGKAGSFMLLSLFAIWMIVRFFQSVVQPKTAQPVKTVLAQ
jgi:hypothetical protein